MKAALALGLVVALVAPALQRQDVGAFARLSAEQFEDVTESSIPPVVKERDDLVWANWEDTDGDGFVNTRTSYGVAWGDFDGDGNVDLWLNNHGGDRFGPPPSLLVNRGDGTFEDRNDLIEPSADGSIASGDRHGSVWADFDNDGDQDLLMLVGLNRTIETSKNKFFINDGGRLVDNAERLGLIYAEARAREAAVFDFDNDGLLDFFHGSIADGSKDPELPPTVFTQNGDGTFTDVGSTVGFEFNESYGLEHVALADFNADGRLEMIQKQPFGIYEFVAGEFVEITDSIFNDMRVENVRGLTDFAVADFNGDLIPDFFLPSSAGSFHQLVLSSPTGWEDVSATSGVQSVPYRTTDGGGVAVGDFDNDMDLDMFVLDRSADGSDYLLENQGSGSFDAVAFPLTVRPADMERPDLRTTAVADFNNDGSLDLLETTNRNDPTYRLLENSGNGNGWLSIVLEGTESNRDGIGATVHVTAGGVTQMRQQTGGVHHRAQDDQRLHFGLSDQSFVDEIQIIWPSGIEQVLKNVAANQVLQITESSGVTDAGGSQPEPETEEPEPEPEPEPASSDPDGPLPTSDTGGSQRALVVVILLVVVAGLGSWRFYRTSRRDPSA